MRLILSNNSLRKPAPLTPEAIFESKYDWLLRWAMHFTQNDREAAEDLVQDAFVRLVTSWPRIKENVEQVEPVLYSYLKYCYLTEKRLLARKWESVRFTRLSEKRRIRFSWRPAAVLSAAGS